MYLASAATIEFVDAMSSHASGVVLVTTRAAGRPWGMTVTAFAPVTVDPPTVLVSLGAGTVAARGVEANGAFGVSMLGSDQAPVAAYSSALGGTKFLDAFVEGDEQESASPAVADALAHFDCEVVETLEVVDHVVFVGRVQRTRRRGGEPLLYQGRGYRSLAPAERSLRCVAS